MLDDQYEVILADTKESIQLHYRLRYQVYCLEKGFEDPKNHPRGEECDQYDARSAHFLVRDKRTKKWIATLRLVLPGKQALPIECLGIIDNEIRNSTFMNNAAEISRVCRLKSEALSTGKQNINVTSDAKKACKENSLILLGLIRAAISYCKVNDIPYIFFLGRPAMARLVSKLYMPFKKAGEACEYKGLRFPYLVTVKNVIKDIADHSPETAQIMSVEEAYRLYSELSHYRQLPLAS